MRRQLAGAAALLALAAPLLAACGEDEGAGASATSEPTPTASEPESTPSPSASTEEPAALPQCAEVWVAGTRLPARYEGCLEDGVEVPPETQPCAFAGAIVTYGDRFYAVRGRNINDVGGPLADSDAYQQALASCRG